VNKDKSNKQRKRAMPAKKKTTASKEPAAPKAAMKAPAAKKTAAKKAEPVKAAPAPAKKTAAKKAPAKKSTAKKAPVQKALLTPEERYQRVQTEAYYIAEQHGFGGDDLRYWLLAEQKLSEELG
jgi:hypothetical protein